jgi:hypothetical protein
LLHLVEKFFRTLALTVSPRSIPYSNDTIQRAELALRCSPFHIKLLQDMGHSGVSVVKIAGSSGVELGYTKRKMPEIVAEADAVWLIQVGMLRREVDGQGLTDSFRLTPLGSQVVARWAGRSLTPPRKRERLKNFVNRWLRSVV